MLQTMHQSKPKDEYLCAAHPANWNVDNKNLYPVVCDSRNMRRYVYLFLNRKPREKQSIQLEPNHRNFLIKLNKMDF